MQVVDWDCAAGLRIEFALDFAGYVRGERYRLFTINGVDRRGRPTSVGISFRNNGRVFFFVLPGDIDAYIICEQSRAGTTDYWLQGEAHRISCGWGEDGQFVLFTDDDRATTHRPTQASYLPVKLTSISVLDEAGPVTDCRVWLDGEGIGPRPPETKLPIKIAPPTKLQVSAAVGIPLSAGFALADAEVYASAHPQVVVECPEGVTPYRYAKTFRLFFGRFPYQTIKGGLTALQREGVTYTRFVYHIPKTKVGRATRTLYPYRLQFTFGTTLAPGPVPPVYFYAEWDGGSQQPVPVRVEAVPIDPEPFRFEQIPAGLWCDVFAPDIRRYCGVQGVNFVVAQVPEADMPGGSLTLQEARNRLGPGIELDIYSRHIWWRRGLPKWQEEHAFTRSDGTVNTQFPCLSYRGPEWFEDRARADRLMRKGIGGIQTDIECEVYAGCFHADTLARFRTFAAREYPDLPLQDPRVFEKDPEKHPDLHQAWVAFQGRLMSEYYLTLVEGLAAAARELGLTRKPRLSIYNDIRHGRKGADLTYLYAQDLSAVAVYHAPPLYQTGWTAGDWMRDQVRKFPKACPVPYIGRPSSGRANMEEYVYEVFANGARGFIIFSRGWHDGAELQQLSRGLRHIHKIEGLISRARMLDAPTDLAETIRIRAVGVGDEKFLIVAQHQSELGYRKASLQETVQFSIFTAGPAVVTDLRTGAELAKIAPGSNTVTVRFTAPGVVPLHVRPVSRPRVPVP